MTLSSSMFEVRHPGDQIDVHAAKISALEEADRQHDERLKKLEDNAMKLENTVVSESRETLKS